MNRHKSSIGREMKRNRGRAQLWDPLYCSSRSGFAKKSTPTGKKPDGISLIYIELFYKPKCHHGYAGGVAPVEFENQYFNRLKIAY